MLPKSYPVILKIWLDCALIVLQLCVQKETESQAHIGRKLTLESFTTVLYISKVLEFDHAMSVVVLIVNYLLTRKVKHHLFKLFLEEVDGEYGDIVYHTDIRRLSHTMYKCIKMVHFFEN